ncbi:hypothetical protein [Pelagicoccus sp. SDUM812003]|nr:hypothetical protein [Pelagicoccus sp. SDUM812003]MDQ8203029.1 hypothetical protein [Pelagicoccus sp. SDUM812003]
MKKKVSQMDSDIGANPPVFGTWSRVYWFVAVFFFAEVVLFYFFTRYYS